MFGNLSTCLENRQKQTIVWSIFLPQMLVGSIPLNGCFVINVRLLWHLFCESLLHLFSGSTYWLAKFQIPKKDRYPCSATSLPSFLCLTKFWWILTNKRGERTWSNLWSLLPGYKLDGNVQGKAILTLWKLKTNELKFLSMEGELAIWLSELLNFTETVRNVTVFNSNTKGIYNNFLQLLRTNIKIISYQCYTKMVPSLQPFLCFGIVPNPPTQDPYQLLTCWSLRRD